MATCNQAHVFGDQSLSYAKSLQHLVQVRSQSAQVDRFLRCAFRAISQELTKLSATERQRFPNVDTLNLLARAASKGSLHPALDSACACINQIGIFLEADIHVSPNSSYLLGICTGALASATVACANTPDDIIGLGVEAVKVAFRTGLTVARLAASLAPVATGSWSAVVAGVSIAKVEDVVSQWHESQEHRSAASIYISGVGLNSVTVSGAPNALQQLLAAKLFGTSARAAILPIDGPYHCGSLLKDSNIETILKEILGDIRFGSTTQRVATVACAAEGKAILTGETFQSLLAGTIEDILLRQVRLDRAAQSLAELSITKITGYHSQFTPSLATWLSKTGRLVAVENTAEASKDQEKSRSDNNRNKIAIIGYSGRFPEADDLDEFWNLLCEGVDTYKPVPADRFDGDAHYHETLQNKNSSRVKHGCWIKEPGKFDTRFFQVSPREAAQTDPAQRLALLTAYEALEMAGFVPDRTESTRRHRVGVFYGTTSDDWREVNSAQNIDTYFVPGGNRAFIPGRINYFFKFSGPSVSVDTACSSSLAAINLAVTALLNGDCDSAVAGGTNVLTNPDNFAGLDRGHFLTPKGNCKTFDDGADGYCRADAVGSVILKRLDDAIADKDPIQAVILGARTNHSAEAVSITRPLADAQEYLFRRLLSDCHVDPHDIGYIEMHGTGTQAGDAVEMTSVLNTFAWDHSRRTDQTLHLGSVKSNVGHGESASGVTGLIKVLLMMQKNTIPMHVGIKTKINHHFPPDLEQRGIRIALKNTAWPRPADGGKRKVFVDNFSAAGGNTTVLLEDADVLEFSDIKDTREYHVVTVSARSASSLKQNMLSLADYLESQDVNDLLSKVGYTTTARKLHHNYRAAFTATGVQQLTQALRSKAEATATPRPTKAGSVGFMFTGQGAQATAMAAALYLNFSSFRRDMEQFDNIVKSHGYGSFLPLVTGTQPIENLSALQIQTGTCAIQIAMSRFWVDLGLRPRFVLGHSLGEYAALHAAGVLSVSDTLWLCGFRAQLLEKSCKSDSHGMMAVNASLDSLTEVLSSHSVEIACVNGPQATVLTGTVNALQVLGKEFVGKGVVHKILSLPFAFHSAQMDPILDALEEGARRVTFQKPAVPVVSALLGKIVEDEGVFGPSYIRRHCREQVNFLGALNAARDHFPEIKAGTITNVEMGSHPLLAGMTKSTYGADFKHYATLKRGENAFKTLSETLSSLYSAGIDIKWDRYHQDFEACQVVLPLPSYRWDYGKHWIQYQHNWCLTKGDAPAVVETIVASPPEPAARISDSVHTIIMSSKDVHGKVSLVVQSDLHDDRLIQVCQQHRVNGLTLVPSSLYADIAFTLAKHVIADESEEKKTLMPSISEMEVSKALILNETEASQLIQVRFDFDWTTSFGDLKFYSVDARGQETVTHATCKVGFHDPVVWSEEWRNRLPLVKRCIDNLISNAELGSVHKIGRGLAYKLFSSAVEYGPIFQGMQEVYFDSSRLESFARVRFPTASANFAINPCWIDSLGHLTGFTMNANDSLNLSEHVYINHGWKFMFCTESFDSSATYQTFVSMQALHEDDRAFSGDVYILRNNRIVGVFGQVTFNRIAKKVLNLLLPRPRVPAPTGSTPNVRSAELRPAVSQNKAVAKSTLDSEAFEKIQPASSALSKPKLARTASAPSSLIQEGLKLISKASSVASDQLTDDTQFSDLGIDSLMSLDIIESLKEDLGIDVPSSLFQDFPSVASLREFMESIDPSPIDFEVLSDSDISSSESPSEIDTGASTPLTAPDSGVEDDFIDAIMLILADELGISVSELTKNGDVSNVGLGSLSSSTIVSRIRDELCVDLPNDIFTLHTEINEIIKAIYLATGRSAQSSKPVLEIVDRKLSAKVKRVHPSATSTLLQSSSVPEKAQSTLFLFPDGSGSASSYMALPCVSPQVRVIGLNCPYLKKPEELTCSLQDLTDSYLTEIRRRQPHGPYILAGWSAGGIAAYDATIRLIEQGEQVDQLILLDSPNPIGLTKLPQSFYTTLENAGAFGGHIAPASSAQKAPKWLIRHFLAFIEALDLYDAVPLKQRLGATAKLPEVTLIWATDGICGGKSGLELPRDRSTETREMTWLMDDRKDLKFNGWDALIEKSRMKVKLVEGANHFNLVRDPWVGNLATLLGRIISA